MGRRVGLERRRRFTDRYSKERFKPGQSSQRDFWLGRRWKDKLSNETLEDKESASKIGESEKRRKGESKARNNFGERNRKIVGVEARIRDEA